MAHRFILIAYWELRPRLCKIFYFQSWWKTSTSFQVSESLSKAEKVVVFFQVCPSKICGSEIENFLFPVFPFLWNWSHSSGDASEPLDSLLFSRLLHFYSFQLAQFSLSDCETFLIQSAMVWGFAPAIERWQAEDDRRTLTTSRGRHCHPASSRHNVFFDTPSVAIIYIDFSKQNTRARLQTAHYSLFLNLFLFFCFPVKPEDRPQVVGFKPRYRVGDILNITCHLRNTFPSANITWFVSGEKVI